MDQSEYAAYSLMSTEAKKKRMAEIDFKLCDMETKTVARKYNELDAQEQTNSNTESTSYSLGIAVDKENVSYIEEISGNGSHCDLTGKPRVTEIQYRCSLIDAHFDGFVSSINEIATCKYQVIVYLASLCSLPGFTQKDVGDEIKCQYVKGNEDTHQPPVVFTPGPFKGELSLKKQEKVSSSLEDLLKGAFMTKKPIMNIHKSIPGKVRTIMLDDENHDSIGNLIKETLKELTEESKKLKERKAAEMKETPESHLEKKQQTKIKKEDAKVQDEQMIESGVKFKEIQDQGIQFKNKEEEITGHNVEAKDRKEKNKDTEVEIKHLEKEEMGKEDNQGKGNEMGI